MNRLKREWIVQHNKKIQNGSCIFFLSFDEIPFSINVSKPAHYQRRIRKKETEKKSNAIRFVVVVVCSKTKEAAKWTKPKWYPKCLHHLKSQTVWCQAQRDPSSTNPDYRHSFFVACTFKTNDFDGIYRFSLRFNIIIIIVVLSTVQKSLILTHCW